MRQINKAIFELIKKYHRLYGLEFYVFSHGGFGPGYWGLQSAATRTWCKSSNEVNDRDNGKHIRGGYSLVSYLHNVSIPSWACNEYADIIQGQPALDVSSLTRTNAIVRWFEENMQLRNYFKVHKEEINRWRSTYSVEDAERYILMTNLSGLIAAQKNTHIMTPLQAYQSDYGPSISAQKKLDEVLSGLATKDPRIDIFGIDNYWFCRNGKALINGEIIDCWSEYIDGKAASDILNFYCS